MPAATVARQLAADCRRRALQHARNGAYPQLLLVQAGNRDPVFGLQLLARFVIMPTPYIKGCCTSDLKPPLTTVIN